MKKLIVISLIFAMTLSLTSCLPTYAMYSVGDADAPISVGNAEKNDEGYIEYLDELEEFSAQLTEATHKKYGMNENFVISPISIFMALAIAADAALGQTRQEILDALDMTHEELLTYTKVLYAFSNSEFTRKNVLGIDEVKAFEELANSIWLDKELSFKQSGVDSLNEHFNTDVYHVSFADGSAGNQINKYIENKTRGLIKGNIRFSQLTKLVIMNTFYYKDVWVKLGERLDYTDKEYDFTNVDGSLSTLKLLEGNYFAGRTYETEDYSSFFTSTDNGFKLHFILPKGDNTVSDVFNDDNIEHILSIEDYGYYEEEMNTYHYTRALFPEFNVEFSRDIIELMQDEFGIETIFSERCDFSNLTDTPVYCNMMIHKCMLKVNREGIEGAAMTVITLGESAMMPRKDIYHDFVVDGAFGFVLTDPHGNIVFSGAVNEIE